MDNNSLKNMTNSVSIAFITDQGFLMPTSVAIKSMIDHKNADSVYDIRIIATDCDDVEVSRLNDYSSDNVSISIVKTNTKKYAEIKQLSHITIACLLKFDICDLLPDCEKILYIDGDVYVNGDLTDLFNINIGDAYVGGVKSLDMIGSNLDHKLSNAGVFLFNAKKMREDRMTEKLYKKRMEIGDCGSMDQKVFNILLGDEIFTIPYKYNCVAGMILSDKRLFSIDKLNSLYETGYSCVEDFLNDAIIIHYASGGKPWKYDFVYKANEWYECYKSTYYGNVPLIRKTKLQVRKQVFFDSIKKEGLHGLAGRVKHYWFWLIGRREGDIWG